VAIVGGIGRNSKCEVDRGGVAGRSLGLRRREVLEVCGGPWRA
jgi:hypothetical protein